MSSLNMMVILPLYSLVRNNHYSKNSLSSAALPYTTHIKLKQIIMTKIVKIALIPGDGIGKEVMPEGVRVLEAAASKHGLNLEWTEFDWSCETYLETGQMMPEDGINQLRPLDAVYLGAVGFPSVPDHVSLWGLLIPIRREFDQYVNLRPVRLFEGVPCPLANKKPGDIDFYVVRENVEGE